MNVGLPELFGLLQVGLRIVTDSFIGDSQEIGVVNKLKTIKRWVLETHLPSKESRKLFLYNPVKAGYKNKQFAVNR
jgi:hypothetical protein